MLVQVKGNFIHKTRVCSFRKESTPLGIMTCFGFGIFQVTITDDVDTFVQQVTPANFKLRGTRLLRYAHKVIVIWSYKHDVSGDGSWNCLFDQGTKIRGFILMCWHRYPWYFLCPTNNTH